MRITRFERTVVRVPFQPGILSTDQDWQVRPHFPQNRHRRRHDVLRRHRGHSLLTAPRVRDGRAIVPATARVTG